MSRKIGWYKLKPGAVLEAFDCWTYSKYKQNRHTPMHDIAASNIGKAAPTRERVTYYRFREAS